MSRQNVNQNPSEPSPEQGDSPIERRSDSPGASSSSPQNHNAPRESESSEGYPSWLPKRPLHPAPASTFQSSAGVPTPEPIIVGRKPTPRSVRIVSLADSQAGDGRREPTDQTRVANPHSRVWSRATTAGLSPTVFSARLGQYQAPPPRFKSNGLHLDYLRNPSILSRLHYYLLPLIAFYHIPLQTFFDFNAVYILIQVARHPNPLAPGVPGSGKNWALGAAAYVACWLTWIVVVFIVYELVYSFYRRWRVKRPLILPIYMSSSAFNLASMTSFNTFSFLRYVRSSAFHPEQGGSLRDGLAETFWFYSQNTSTVALLLPRAGLCLALLLTFGSAQPGVLALAASGNILRDRTFFRADNGTLTDYARGVLIANAAWTAWRVLVFLISWIGLWVLSGHGCGGICGPRFRWQEEDAEKTASIYDDNGEFDLDALPWGWKECTRGRIQDAYDFCMPVKHSKRASKKDLSDISESPAPFAGMEQVFAAVGLPSGPQPARRGVLSDRLFETPPPEQEMSEKVQGKATPDFSSVIPPIREKESRNVSPAGPLKDLPYPFVGRGAQVSSTEQVPFPPSPRHSKSDETDEEDEGEDKENIEIDAGTPQDELDDDELEGELEDDEEERSSDRRTSGSLSSLGQPVPSRYPFQYRRPRGGSSLSSRSHLTPQSVKTHSTHTRSTPSRSTNSTGNVESSDSPWSVSSSVSPLSQDSHGIPMPPRHPQAQRRARAGTVPISPMPLLAPRRQRTRTDSGSTSASRLEPSPVWESSEMDEVEEPMEQPEAEGPYEEAESHDSVGLLSAAPSPRTSLIGVRHRPSNLSRRTLGSASSGSRSHSHSQGRSPVPSLYSAPRSRTQSLIHSIGAASQSSLDLVRSRANSMARLSDSPYHSHSDALPSSPENNTFGQPLRRGWQSPSEPNLAEEPSVRDSGSEQGSGPGSVGEPIPELRVFPSAEPSEAGSEGGTILDDHTQLQSLPIPIPGREPVVGDSEPDISTAAQSFITAPATIHGSTTTDSDVPGRTPPGWGKGQQYGFNSSMGPA